MRNPKGLCGSGINRKLVPAEPASTPDAKVADHSRKRRQSAPETDGYEGVVAILDGGRRVITDTGGVQWILQKRLTTGSWSNRSYCCTKEALIRCCGGSTPELDALPDRCGDRDKPTTDMQEAAE